MQFDDTFGRYAHDGQQIETTINGIRFVATIHDDDCQDAPWERGDGHGPVTDWTRRDKLPGELILCDDNPSGLRGNTSRRYYDFQAACKMARRDGWGARGALPGESGRALAARAARENYEALRAWCNDDWRYVGIAVQAFFGDVELTGEFDHALWGIECNYPGSDNSYLVEVANEQLAECAKGARERVKELHAELLAFLESVA